jgi:DNA-directed RNA polymerase subunit H (RpoH/RPB5)
MNLREKAKLYRSKVSKDLQTNMAAKLNVSQAQLSKIKSDDLIWEEYKGQYLKQLKITEQELNEYQFDAHIINIYQNKGGNNAYNIVMHADDFKQYHVEVVEAKNEEIALYKKTNDKQEIELHEKNEKIKLLEAKIAALEKK